mmetsp:Transcript_76479/g.153554  ORF Transcript_76479/g.153554 Transcript_76479/m.153554 type:complete len:287 (-) Transcript_76479:118-978(-)
MASASLSELIRGSSPTLWSDFVDFTAARQPNATSGVHRAERIRRLWKENPPNEDELTVTFSNGHRPPVLLPLASVATRVGDLAVIDALFMNLSSSEIMRGVLQDIADDHSCGAASLLASKNTISCDEHQRAFAVLSAVEKTANRVLPSILVWAHAVGALSVLCKSPALFKPDVWHLPTLENALQTAVNLMAEEVEAATETLNIILNTHLSSSYPLSANQCVRTLRFIFERRQETALNAFVHRFPEVAGKVEGLRFDSGDGSANGSGSGYEAESLRRRCNYRLLYEP